MNNHFPEGFFSFSPPLNSLGNTQYLERNKSPVILRLVEDERQELWTAHSDYKLVYGAKNFPKVALMNAETGQFNKFSLGDCDLWAAHCVLGRGEIININLH